MGISKKQNPVEWVWFWIQNLYSYCVLMPAELSNYWTFKVYVWIDTMSERKSIVYRSCKDKKNMLSLTVLVKDVVSFFSYTFLIFYLENCVGSGAFGEVYIADAVGILSFDPRYKISAKHKPLLSRKRWSFTRTKSDLSRQDSVASTKSNKPLLHNGKDVATVAVKKLKGRKMCMRE